MIDIRVLFAIVLVVSTLGLCRVAPAEIGKLNELIEDGELTEDEALELFQGSVVTFGRCVSLDFDWCFKFIVDPDQFQSGSMTLEITVPDREFGDPFAEAFIPTRFYASSAGNVLETDDGGQTLRREVNFRQIGDEELPPGRKRLINYEIRDPAQDPLSALDNVSARFFFGAQAFTVRDESGNTFQFPDEDVDYSVPLPFTPLPTLSLNRDTGQAELANPVAAPLELTGYSLASPSGQLNPRTWTSLESQQVNGWFEANPSSTLIAELNAGSSSTLNISDPLQLGNPYNGGMPPKQEDVSLQVVAVTPDWLVIVDGAVEYVDNEPVLQVDPVSGEAVIGTFSSVVGPFDVRGYSILSSSGALDPNGWISFADSGADGWVEADARPVALSELNLRSSLRLDGETRIDIGSIFKPGSEHDLVFELATVSGDVLPGAVQYVSHSPTWDCNGDGAIDINDANCTPAADLDSFLADHGFIKGDGDGDGHVQFSDFVILSDNFGLAGRYTDGDFDKDGMIQFSDFVILSENFGQSAAVAVPESSTNLLAVVGVAGLVAAGRRQVRLVLPRKTVNRPIGSLGRIRPDSGAGWASRRFRRCLGGEFLSSLL